VYILKLELKKFQKETSDKDALVQVIQSQTNAEEDAENLITLDSEESLGDADANITCGRTSVAPNLNKDFFRNGRRKRIIGGIDARKYSWPWVVSVRLKLNKSEHMCGGSLIDDEYVITAAHCLTEIFKATIRFQIPVEKIFTIMEIFVGINDHTSADIVDENIYGVKHFDFHNNFGYLDHSLVNDVGIIRLSRKVNLSRREVATVCLPTLDSENSDWVNVDDDVVVAGWGAYAEEFNHIDFTHNHLQQATFKVLDPNCPSCNGGSIRDGWDKKNVMCVHSRNSEQPVGGTCFGDSGGPVVVYRQKRWFLVGIVSFGHLVKDENTKRLKCDATKPSYFVKVAPYLSWIRERMQPMSLQKRLNKTDERRR